MGVILCRGKTLCDGGFARLSRQRSILTVRKCMEVVYNTQSSGLIDVPGPAHDALGRE